MSCSELKDVVLPSTVQSIGASTFAVWQYAQTISSLVVNEKTTAEVQAMSNYPWGIGNTSVIRGSLG